MEILDAEQTAARLPYVALADSISAAAVSQDTSGVQTPSRYVLPLPEGGNLLVMPASDKSFALTKIVTVHPGNSARNLPTIQGEVVVAEAATGRRLGILDGATVTGRRTAALSLLAARELALHQDSPLLIVGAGTQARSHLEAFCEGLGVSQVYISSRTRERAEELAEYAEHLGAQARTIESPGEVLGEVGMIVTATTSREPVLPEDLPVGVFVAAVGAFNPQMTELPPALVARCHMVVDTLEGAREEAGDLIQAESAGYFHWQDATDLADMLLKTPDPSLAGRALIFKSVGHTLWDLAAARLAFDG